MSGLGLVLLRLQAGLVCCREVLQIGLTSILVLAGERRAIFLVVFQCFAHAVCKPTDERVHLSGRHA